VPAVLGPRFRGGDGSCSGEVVDRGCPCRARIGRRRALGLGLALALAPRLGLAQTDAARERPKEGDLLVNVTAAAAPEPLKPDDLALDGKQTLAWPMDPETKTLRSGSRLNKVLLLRLDPEGFDAGSDRIFGNLSAHRVRRHQLASGSAVARMPLPLLDI
jgi:hypothetical protein